MSQGATGRILNEMCLSRICIDEYRDGEMGGRIYNHYYGEPIGFENVMQLLKKLEAMFDRFGCPQRTLKQRNFPGKPPKPVKLAEQKGQAGFMPQEDMGKIATFYVKVMFRKNASWQGNVQWVDAEETQSFRSVFELLMLLDGVLAG